MSEIKMLPCPFCGGKAAAENYVIEAQASCNSCGAKIVRQHGARDDKGLPESITAWNTRATAAQDAEIEALRYERQAWFDQACKQADQRRSAESRAERLAEALRFYADTNNWIGRFVTDPTTPAEEDGGDNARESLRDHDQEAGNG